MLERLRKLTEDELIEIFEENGVTVNRNAINYNCKNVKLTIVDEYGNEYDFDSYTFFDDTYINKENKVSESIKLTIEFTTKAPEYVFQNYYNDRTSFKSIKANIKSELTPSVLTDRFTEPVNKGQIFAA